MPIRRPTIVDGKEPPRQDASSLQQWLARQFRVASSAMAKSISATGLVHHRKGFGQTMVPTKGSVLASPVMASYDPDPDYFFHWARDSALAMTAVTVLIRVGDRQADWARHFEDFLDFSLTLDRISGRDLVRQGDFRKAVDPAFLRYVRPDSELSLIEGDRVLGETRYNPNGTLDFIKWASPQYDGPALRALAVMRCWRLGIEQTAKAGKSVVMLLTRDLGHVVRHWNEPSYDLWEERLDLHYHTQVVQLAALRQGSLWADETGDSGSARRYRAAAEQLSRQLDAFWSPKDKIYRSRTDVASGGAGDALDIAVILGVIHADLCDGAHSVLDDKVQSTLLRLEELFEAEYPINRNREADLGPAMGRYKGDHYYSGGAYYFSTLGVAEFYYRLAKAVASGGLLRFTDNNRELFRRLPENGKRVSIDRERLESEPERRSLAGALIAKGDAVMATIRKYTPATGELSEQFDKATGEQTSAKDLTWSYAAFITAFDARNQAHNRLRMLEQTSAAPSAKV